MEDKTQNITLSFVIPSYEKHYESFCKLLASVAVYCDDPDNLEIVLIIERKNLSLFEPVFKTFQFAHVTITFTENILERFGTHELPTTFLTRVGKFTFQAIKKLGGVEAASAPWTLVLDCESEFLKPFSVTTLLSNYREKNYIFYTHISARLPYYRDWFNGQVASNCQRATQAKFVDCWPHECYAWFYNRSRIADMLRDGINEYFWDCFRDNQVSDRPFFESILYAMYMAEHHPDEITLVDFLAEAKAMLDPTIWRIVDAFAKTDGQPFGVFEFLLFTLRPEDIKSLAPIYEKYKIPFIRLEPATFDYSYIEKLLELPYFCGLTASHKLLWMRKKIAVCISGNFPDPINNVGQIKKFTTGTHCDVFLHSWLGPANAIVLNEIKPRAYAFDPSISSNEKIDEAVSALYSIKQAFDLLLPFKDEYDFAIFITADAFCEISLKDLLQDVGESGDVAADTVYVSAYYHAQGLNPCMAFGTIATMMKMAQAYSYSEKCTKVIENSVEGFMLGHVLEMGLHIMQMDMPYVRLQMRGQKINDLVRAKNEQLGSSNTKNLELPLYRDITAFFHDKWRAQCANDARKMPELYRVALNKVANAQTADYLIVRKQSSYAQLYFAHGRSGRPFPVVIEKGSLVITEKSRALSFAYVEDGKLILSEWLTDDRVLCNEHIELDASNIELYIPMYTPIPK